MDHVVYLDAQANELENLLSGNKTMIIPGATGRKLSHGHVAKNETLGRQTLNRPDQSRQWARLGGIESRSLRKRRSCDGKRY